VSVSLTVNGRTDLTGVLEDLANVAEVHAKKDKAIVAIICDAAKSSQIVADGFAALAKEGINVQMISQGANKVNISLIVDTTEADRVVKVLHAAFFK